MKLSRIFRPSLLTLGLLLLLPLPVLLEGEVLIVNSRREAGGGLPVIGSYLFPVFLIAFGVGVVLLLTALVRAVARRRRTI